MEQKHTPLLEFNSTIYRDKNVCPLPFMELSFDVSITWAAHVNAISEDEGIQLCKDITLRYNNHQKLIDALKSGIEETERGRNVVAMANKECGFPEPQPIAWVVAAKALLHSLETETEPIKL